MSLHELIEALGDYAGLGPGIVLALAVSLLTFVPVSRAFAISKAHGFLLVLSLGFVLAATVTPSREALLFGAEGSGRCDLSRFGLLSWWELRHIDDASLNILLFVPFGIALGMCPRSRARSALVAVALITPVAIELIQLTIVSLGRECQSSDVIDNLSGLLLGLLVGVIARSVFVDRRASKDGEADE
jgi:hypothetical protein